jgi:hypothetical protein
MPAERLAKIDLTTGDPDTTFTQATGFNANVDALAISGNFLFVAGNFYTYRGAPAQGVAKIDRISGDLVTTLGPFNGQVNDLAASGSSLYVAGHFDTYQGAPAQRLAKIDLTTGSLDATFSQSTGFNNPA